MALDSLTSQAVLGHAAGPTLLQQFQARQAEAEKAELDKQVTLSNLATQAVQRQGMMQEQEQSQYNFDQKRQRIDAIGQLVEKAMAEPDPETRFNAIRNMQATLMKYGADPQELYAFQGFVKSMSPKEDFGYQQEEAGLGLEDTRSQIADRYSAMRARELTSQAALIRAQDGGKKVTYKPLQAQEKNDIQNSVSGMEWFDELGGSWDRRAGRFKPGTSKAQALGDVALGIDYLRQEAAKMGIELSKDDAYARLMLAIQTEGGPVVKNRFTKNEWDSDKFRSILEQEKIKLSSVVQEEPLSGLYKDEAGNIVDENGNLVDLSQF